jgi:DinB family
LINENEKYFLNSLRSASCHVALSSFQSSGRITTGCSGRSAARRAAEPERSYHFDPRTPCINRKEVIEALSRSNQTMLKLLKACIDNGGKLPSTPAWLNFPNDIVHFLAYFIAHEGHHRGQIIMLARQIDRRLPTEVTGGVWQWKKRLKEAK